MHLTGEFETSAAVAAEDLCALVRQGKNSPATAYATNAFGQLYQDRDWCWQQFAYAHEFLS